MYTCQSCKNWKFQEDDGKNEAPVDSGLYYCDACYEKGNEHKCDCYCDCQYYDVEPRSYR